MPDRALFDLGLECGEPVILKEGQSRAAYGALQDRRDFGKASSAECANNSMRINSTSARRSTENGNGPIFLAAGRWCPSSRGPAYMPLCATLERNL
jgi:hypothetical protein